MTIADTFRNEMEKPMVDLTRLLHAKAIDLGRLAIRATTAAGAGHPTTALSLAHLVTVLMYRVMRWTPADPGNPGSDRLVLSEGHAVPILYAACTDLGVAFEPDGKRRVMTERDLMTLRDIGSPIDGHPNPVLGFPFFDAATGSLGQGLSVAAGLACAARVDGVPKRIFCLIGDGESREGQIWEALDFCADQRLGGVTAIFNCNTLGQSDYVSPAQDWEHLAAKAAAFGARVEIIDGHDPAAIERALRITEDSRPVAVIARTVKGWGVPSLGGPGHHGTPVKPEALTGVLAELDATARHLGVTDGGAPMGAQDFAALTIAPPIVVSSGAPAARGASHAPASFDEARAKYPALASAKKLSPRRAYGMALAALGDANEAVVALDADVKNSTYAETFAKAHPDRYFEARIAEQNMVSVAAGLAAAGKIAFVSTFGRFLERAFDQIEMAIIGGARIKLVGTHVGVTLASDGPSQMALADIAFARALAHARDAKGRSLVVLTPSDAVSAYKLVLAMAEYDGAAYLRAVRGDLPILYRDDESFPLRGSKVVRRPAEAPAVLLAASGYLVHSCLEAAVVLEQRGVAAAVVDAYALPLDAEPILEMTRQARAAVLAVEDNYTGGLGSELAEASAALAAPVRVESLGVRRIPKSGRTAADVLDYVGLSVPEIAAAAERLARRDGG
jgi:transketolase